MLSINHYIVLKGPGLLLLILPLICPHISLSPIQILTSASNLLSHRFQNNILSRPIDGLALAEALRDPLATLSSWKCAGVFGIVLSLFLIRFMAQEGCTS